MRSNARAPGEQTLAPSRHTTVPSESSSSARCAAKCSRHSACSRGVSCVDTLLSCRARCALFGLGGESAEEAREILRWQLWDNHKLSSQAGMTRFLMNFLPEDKRPAEVIAFTQGRLKAAYQVLDAHLAGRDWIVGDGPTHADFSCCGYLFYPEPFGFARGDWPEIDRWLSNIEALDGWKHPYDLMPGSPADRV